jgi:hypothetical protein
MQLPSGVYTKYNEAMSLFLTEFGTACYFVYLSTEVATNVDPIKNKLMASPYGTGGMKRGSELTKVVETREAATLRVYRDKKSFGKIGDIVVPEGGCVTIGAGSLLPSMRKASYLLVDSERFERIANPQTWGLNGEYSVCWWKLL